MLDELHQAEFICEVATLPHVKYTFMHALT
jgi:hypothetical protein